MVQDDFVGSECTDGIIPAHPDYRLELSDERKDRFLFWRYFEPPVAGKKPSWGSKEFRYVSNWKTAHLLLDIYSVAQEPEKQLSRDFFEYFCRLNKFNSEVLISHLQKKEYKRRLLCIPLRLCQGTRHKRQSNSEIPYRALPSKLI